VSIPILIGQPATGSPASRHSHFSQALLCMDLVQRGAAQVNGGRYAVPRAPSRVATPPRIGGPARQTLRRGVMEPPNMRRVVLHVIDEVVRRYGHLEIGRELLDVATRLGQKLSERPSS
jgi:hypothetical protein